MTHHLFDQESPFQRTDWAYWPFSNRHSPECNCPAMTSWRVDRDARSEWKCRVFDERRRQILRGYDARHDDAHGVEHLLSWAGDYARRGEPVKSAALIEAAREALERLAESQSRGSE